MSLGCISLSVMSSIAILQPEKRHSILGRRGGRECIESECEWFLFSVIL